MHEQANAYVCTVMIVDDHAVVRAGLRLLVDSQRDMSVVAEASDGQQAIALAAAMKPRVIIMDLSLPDMGGIAATEHIMAFNPEARVIALTMHEDHAYLRSFFSVGGRGYVPKKAADTHLLDAIRSVKRGQIFVDPSLSGGIVSNMLLGSSLKRKQTTRPVLSKREQTVLEMLAQGYTNSDIATRMKLSVKTVDTYRARCSSKLGLRSRPQIVRYALEMGLLTPDKFLQ